MNIKISSKNENYEILQQEGKPLSVKIQDYTELKPGTVTECSL